MSKSRNASAYLRVVGQATNNGKGATILLRGVIIRCRFFHHRDAEVERYTEMFSLCTS